MRLNYPLDKILSSKINIRVLRIFCRAGGELSGRQTAKMAAVTPKTAHEVLQGLMKEGLLFMRVVGKTYLFRLNKEHLISGILKDLFGAEEMLKDRLLKAIIVSIKRSSLKNDILSIALFGSIYEKTEGPSSDVDLLVVVKTAKDKKNVEDLFFKIDERISSGWGNPIAPYVNSVLEFRSKAKMKTGAVSNILKAYQLIYGDRLEKLLR
ncbi:MAG: nucleotidyltransferase domain-containing protein [Candidatus Omnitrophota bacterium]